MEPCCPAGESGGQEREAASDQHWDQSLGELGEVALHPVPEGFLWADWRAIVAAPWVGPVGDLVAANCHSGHGLPLQQESVGPSGER